MERPQRVRPAVSEPAPATHPSRRGLLAAGGGLAAATWLGAPRAAASTAIDPTTGSGPAKPAGQGVFTLARSGHATATLLWWGDETAAFAARELARYAASICGARVSVVAARLAAGSTPRAVTSGVLAIAGSATGPSTIPWSWLADADARLSGAPADTFLIGGSATRLVMSGVGQRGPLYAAYALLEELGVRFFAPEFGYYQGAAEQLPAPGGLGPSEGQHGRDLVVDTAPRLTRPVWPLRRKDIEEGWSINAANLVALIDWMAKQRLNVLVFPYDYYGAGVTRYDDFRQWVAPAVAARGMTLEVGGHGYNSFLPPAQYPQYYTSGTNVFDVHNDAAVTQYVDNVVAYLKSRPEIAIFDCWPPDGAQWPKATLAEYGTATNAETHVVNTLVAALAMAGLSVQVERIAYDVGLEPPTSGYTFDDGVLIDFAAYGRTYTVPLDDPSSATNAGYLSVLKQWLVAHAGPVAVYDYSLRYRWRELPGDMLDVLAQDAACYAGLGLQGTESYSEPGNWLQFEAKHLFIARSAWQPSLTAEGFLADYLPDRFGTAASELATYFSCGTADPDTLAQPGGPASFAQRYQIARDALTTARGRSAGDQSRQLVLGRLGWGCDLALADVAISQYDQAGDTDQTQAAADEYRRLTELYRFDGVQVESSYVSSRYDESVGRAQIAAEYRAPAWGYLPETQLTLAAGGNTTLAMAAQDVDFHGHQVAWSLRLPAGLDADRVTGTLAVTGAVQQTETVRLSATAGIAAGSHTVTVDFSVAGTALTTAACVVSVS